MFGKKEEKCPNFGQILSTLELKMDIVEILLENNEDNIKEQFDFCNYKRVLHFKYMNTVK